MKDFGERLRREYEESKAKNPPKMPFGKYKDELISEIPDEYLIWLVNSIDLQEPLSSHVEEEMTERGIDANTPQKRSRSTSRNSSREEGYRRNRERSYQAQVKVLSKSDIESVVGIWFRRQALNHHPDRGGSEQVMRALNDARDALLDLLRNEGVI